VKTGGEGVKRGLVGGTTTGETGHKIEKWRGKDPWADEWFRIGRNYQNREKRPTNLPSESGRK